MVQPEENRGADSKYSRSGTRVNSRVPSSVSRAVSTACSVLSYPRSALFPINLSPVIIFFAKSKSPRTSSLLEPDRFAQLRRPSSQILLVAFR
jgi:hypothetical protein